MLRTAIAPSFAELGKLAAVAAIRTALNFFLAREIAEERRAVAEGRSEGRSEGQPAGRRAGDTGERVGAANGQAPRS